MPLISRNCLRTSSTNWNAARVTALIANEQNRNGTAPPISRPMKTCVQSMRIPMSSRPASAMNERNRAVAAITAVAIARPLVRALVVLPTASSLATILLALESSPSSFSAPDISKMPFALSEIGPKVSIASIKPVVERRPRPERAIP